MNERTTARSAWRLAFVAVALIVASAMLLALRSNERFPNDGYQGIMVDAAFISFAIVGAVIVSKQPANAVGRLFLLMGISAGIAVLCDAWVRSVPPLPGRTVAALIATPAFLGGFIPLVIVLLVFPDGRLLSRRWRRAVWLTVVAGTIIAVGGAMTPRLADYPDVDNPLGMDWVTDSPIEEGGIGWTLALLAFVIAAISVIVRYRRSAAADRQRLKWLLGAAALVAIGWILQGVGYDIHSGLGEAMQFVFFLAILVFPMAVGIAILRGRLYDIDVVINRTLVYGGLAVFITGVYVTIVVGVGSLVGTGDEPNMALQVAATAVVAVAFQPVRHQVQRFANTLLFGERATPYQVMMEFAERIGGALSVDDALPRIAEAAARGVGATSATVRLLGPSPSERAITWPPDAGVEASRSTTVDVLHGGERVGSISVAKRVGEDVTSAERALLTDVAAQAGIALRNVGMTLELQDRLALIEQQADQLRRSRQRLVTARDVQRRRLERDIRDGAQRQLERIGRRLREATELVEHDPDGAGRLLEEIDAETGAALERLRDLARGIFPPLLADEGIAAALEAHMRKLEISGELSSALDGARFDPHVEAAVYFCCVQALQNAVRHAPGSRVDVRLERDGEALVFSVRDDGTGFDPRRVARGMGFDIMQDRMEALGGTLDVASSPGSGTTVIGRVPARVVEAVAS